MSMMHCNNCDHIFDSDYDTECPKCGWGGETDDDDARAYAEERQQNRIEQHNHPAEGPNI